MKKLFSFLAAICCFYAVHAQTLVISNGEDTGTGWWAAGSAGSVDIWDNPSKDAVNGTDKSMTVWINNGDASYTGAGLSGLNIDVNTYDAISVMVFKRITGTVRLELQNGVQSYFATANYTTPGAWQKLTFAIPSGTGNITTLLVAPHFEDYTINPIPDGESHRMWWDEVVAYKQATSGIGEESSSLAEMMSTQVYSLSGHLLQNASKGESINWNAFPKGIYLVKKVDSAGKISNEKVFQGK